MRLARQNWLLVVGLTVGLAACENQETFVAALSGANEVPATTSNVTGTATFTVVDNTSVTYDITTAQTISNVTAAHIHPGSAGQNGSPFVTLFAPSAPTGGVTSVASGTFTEADITGMSLDSLLTRMRNGTVYVNVHTTNFPAGEIRGQVATQQ